MGGFLFGNRKTLSVCLWFSRCYTERMKQPKLEESPIDHHIQAHVLQVLFRDGGVVAFSDLKPDDVQNSLFMYHVHKLEVRGLVERIDEGFSITPSGARWVNYVSPGKLKPRLTPRVLIKFLLFSPDRTKLVISKRRSAAAEHLNQYLLPSGLQKYGVSFKDSSEAIIESLTGEKPVLKDLGIHETIFRYSDGYVHHSISPFYEATIETDVFPKDEHYELEWVAVGDVLAGKYDPSLTEILTLYNNGENLFSRTFDVTIE